MSLKMKLGAKDLEALPLAIDSFWLLGRLGIFVLGCGHWQIAMLERLDPTCVSMSVALGSVAYKKKT